LGFRTFFGETFATFPDRTGRVEQAIAEENRVVEFTDWSGTHRGPSLGVPPTGTWVVMRTADMFRVTDGKVAEQWDVVDILPVLSRLEVLPPSKLAPDATPAQQ